MSIEAVNRVEIPDDNGFCFILSHRWRKALLFDFSVFEPTPHRRTERLPQLFGHALTRLMFQEMYSTTDAQWARLFEWGWFPFVGLTHDHRQPLLSWAMAPAQMGMDFNYRPSNGTAPQLAELESKLTELQRRQHAANVGRELGERLTTAGVGNVATAAALGDTFQYVIDHPITLVRRKSALLPIIGKDIEGTKLSIYNEGVQTKQPSAHPVRAGPEDDVRGVVASEEVSGGVVRGRVAPAAVV
jgi:hypothetical protein